MAKLPKIALGAWAWRNDGTFGNSLTAESLKPIFDTAMANLGYGICLWHGDLGKGSCRILKRSSERILSGIR